MPDSLKTRLMQNTFVDLIRSQMRFDHAQYSELCELLGKLADQLDAEPTIDKDLALFLYSGPQMVRNAFLSLGSADPHAAGLASELEDAWIELDRLVLRCLKK